VTWRAAALIVLLSLLAGAGSTADHVIPVAAGSCGPVRYEGDGEPDLIVVSDLPLRGIGAGTTKLMVDAIELVLREREFRAGEYGVGYQSCNDTVGDEPYDPLLCRQNARAYVAAADVVGIIGPWNSGCAVDQIPIVSRKGAGPLAMISPSNTFAGLTRADVDPTAPDLYPDGVRSYLRVVTHDFAQGAAAAELAARRGERVALVHQDLSDEYVSGLTRSFLSYARGVGLHVRQFEWTDRASYESLAASVAATRPNAVFLPGLTQLNAKQLIEDLRAALPRGVTLIGPDSFAAAEIARELGAAGDGMHVTVPSIPIEALPPAGKRIVRELGLTGGDPGAIGVPEAAQAAAVLLDAIGRSDGTRASVVGELFASKVEGGILGSFSFDRFGDILPAPVGLYRFEHGEIVVAGVVRARRPGD
jgi:branched-chain amino acid transport system substrate-binding protein